MQPLTDTVTDMSYNVIIHLHILLVIETSKFSVSRPESVSPEIAREEPTNSP